MKQNEILSLLEEKGIISVIDEEYLITEKYKEILANDGVMLNPAENRPKKVQSYDQLLNAKSNGNEWPAQIQEAVGRHKVVQLMNLCEIPITPKGKQYRLRSIDADTVNLVGNILGSPQIHPSTFIEAVQLYYKYTEMPKSFKKLLAEGDALDMYNEHIEGLLMPSLVGTDVDNPQAWR